jgi:hypothetical protein
LFLPGTPVPNRTRGRRLPARSLPNADSEQQIQVAEERDLREQARRQAKEREEAERARIEADKQQEAERLARLKRLTPAERIEEGKQAVIIARLDLERQKLELEEQMKRFWVEADRMHNELAARKDHGTGWTDPYWWNLNSDVAAETILPQARNILLARWNECGANRSNGTKFAIDETELGTLLNIDDEVSVDENGSSREVQRDLLSRVSRYYQWIGEQANPRIMELFNAQWVELEFARNAFADKEDLLRLALDRLQQVQQQ